MTEWKMLKLISFIAAIVIVGALATSVHALPGSSVSLGGAQFNLTGNVFTTGSGSSTVAVGFIDSSDILQSFFTDAQLIITPVDFTSGLTSGTGGGFSILSSVIDGSVPLLSGGFGSGSTLFFAGGTTVFEASLISSFVNPNVGLVGTSYFAPGSFSASMNIASGPFDANWTTTGAAVATISSTVPEPASLMLLGAGLAGIGIWSWRRKSTKS